MDSSPVIIIVNQAISFSRIFLWKKAKWIINRYYLSLIISSFVECKRLLIKVDGVVLLTCIKE
jgi:hypothetical protein